jgi:CxxC motif-containing protein (DUF1111 family)
VPSDNLQALAVTEGEAAFETIGCALCHRREIGNVAGIYSDLLLHDMGSALSDPVPANSRRRHGAMGGYSGGFIDASSVADASANTATQEWRTPPLWGIRESAPYLHDGRAATVEEAIVLHGGEALTSVENYLELSLDQRASMVAFLNCLVAPDGS